MNKHEHLIQDIRPGSIAEELEIEPGDSLVSVNGEEILDLFDYQYLTEDDELDLLIRKPDGEEWLYEIEKDPDEDLGLIFPPGLMDEYRSCRNKCIFCFIDQMPPGMRKTLYFKDDDARLSFLQGNYITLTNLSEEDVERIIRYRLSPINISVHTTDPALRCRMLNNQKAGVSLSVMDRFYAAGIEMNAQIVLCRGINDGDKLNETIERLSRYLPYLSSLSVVPVGLTKYRERLYPLEAFTPADAEAVIGQIHAFQEKLYPLYENHFVHASDEWYLLAGLPLPEADSYDGYPQLENGVGMLRLLIDEAEEALAGLERSATQASGQAAATAGAEDRQGEEDRSPGGGLPAPDGQSPSGCLTGKMRHVSVATGLLAADAIASLAARTAALVPGLEISVYPVKNRFFGERITVSGLLTGGDLKEALSGKALGEELLLPVNMLRSGEEVFLDDMTVPELSDSLQVPIRIVESNGIDLIEKLVGTDGKKA